MNNKTKQSILQLILVLIISMSLTLFMPIDFKFTGLIALILGAFIIDKNIKADNELQ